MIISFTALYFLIFFHFFHHIYSAISEISDDMCNCLAVDTQDVAAHSCVVCYFCSIINSENSDFLAVEFSLIIE